MRAAVFGANGYIGRHLVHYLVHQKNIRPAVFDVQPEFNGDEAVSYQMMNIADAGQWGKWDAAFDIIYFFAGLTGTEVSFDRYEQFVQVNELGLLHLLNRIKDLPHPPKVIFPSTRLVYKGVKDTPLKEDAEKEWKTVYASSKYNGELYLNMYRRLYGIDYSIFRICVPYGNLLGGNQSYGTISFFLDRALKGQPIGLYGDGTLKRTFTHIGDICRQVTEVSALELSSGECYNVDGETYSLLDIATIIAKKYGVDVTFHEWPARALQLESGDTIFDGSKIRQCIEKPCQHALQQWINL